MRTWLLVLAVAVALGQPFISYADSLSIPFTKDLKPGVTDPEVKLLQEFLNTHGFPVGTLGAGSRGQETLYFGTRTKTALTAFQDAHAAAILIPLGLTTGTGNFFSSTRSFVNAILSTTTTAVAAPVVKKRSSHGGRGSNSSSPSPSSFSVGGTVSGLSGTVELQNNATDTLAVSSNGGFTFSSTLSNLASYVVSVLTHPAHQLCAPSSGSGSIAGANVTSVQVDCYTFPTISFPVMTRYYTTDDRVYTLSPSSNSSGTFSYTSSNEAVATISGGSVVMVGYGTTTITAIQATSSPYAASTTSTYLQAYGDICGDIGGSACSMHGTCSNVPPSSSQCTCDASYSGAECELSTINCDGTGLYECVNSGVCTPDGSGGYCTCPAPFTGQYCQNIDIGDA